MFKKLSLSEKRLILILLIIIILYCYLSFFLFPIFDRMNGIRESINKYNNFNPAAAHKSNESILDEKIINEIKYSIPDMERNYEIAYNIKVIADKTMVELESLAFGEISAYSNVKGKIYTIPVNLTVAGVSSDIESFLNLVENDKRICKIDNVNINNINEYTAETSVNVKYFCTGGE